MGQIDDLWRYDGRRAVVTGCASGIGAEVARQLTELGAEVVGLDLKQPALQLKEFHEIDLSDPANIDRAVASIDGPVDALFNVAGVSSGIGDPLRVVTCVTEAVRKAVSVDGLATSYLEAGQGDPVVLLHGGEFGVSAELGWERNVAALAAHYRVLAPDMLGFGQSAKVIDFNDGRGMRIRHIARFCAAVGVSSAHFVGNSMGAVNMFADATSESPLLPAATLTMICGGGEIQRNKHWAALYDYDATLAGMHRIVEALFFDPAYPNDDACVQRRYESSIAPGAWEALAAARFRRPGLEPPPLPSSKRAYERITVPTLVVEGACDKLLTDGWAAEIAKQIPHGRSAVVEKAGHCPQIEQPAAVNELLLAFLDEGS